jgi:hypothetical protein
VQVTDTGGGSQLVRAVRFPAAALDQLVGTDAGEALKLAGLALRTEQDKENGSQTYRLRIDGPLLRQQRKVLIGIIAGQEHTEEPQKALDGLLDLLDEIADQAHDRHGIDCLLCECEGPGSFYSGVPGIFAHVENGKLVPETKVERCDLCQRYPSDQAAFDKLQELGYVEP